MYRILNICPCELNTSCACASSISHRVAKFTMSLIKSAILFLFHCVNSLISMCCDCLFVYFILINYLFVLKVLWLVIRIYKYESHFVIPFWACVLVCNIHTLFYNLLYHYITLFSFGGIQYTKWLLIMTIFLLTFFRPRATNLFSFVRPFYPYSGA